jgi:NitT/TauT family transport system substrate-binding protein
VAFVLASGMPWSAARAADAIPFKVGISTVVDTITPLFVAQDEGFFKKNGLDVQLLNMNGGSRGVRVLIAGDIQVMHVGLSPVLPADKQGADLKLILASTNTIPFTIFSPKNIKTGAQLKGGKVGISSFGSESDIAVTFALKKLGLTRKDVTVLQLGGSSQRFAALTSGQVQAVPLLEPLTTKAREQGLNPLVDLAAAHVPWVFDGVVMKESYLKTHHDVAVRFAKAYVEGAYFALSNEQRTKEILAKWFKTDNKQVIAASYKDFKSLMPRDAAPSREGAKNVIAEMEAAGKPVGSKNVSDYIDGSVIAQLKKEGFFEQMKKKYHL